MIEQRISRRTLLGWGVGVAGLGSLPLAWARRAPGDAPDLSAKAPSSPVAIGRCSTYERKEVTERLAQLFSDIGGIGPLVKGKTITVKVNITGGPGGSCQGLPAERTYQTHPNVILATADLLHRAGARRIRFVESVFGNMAREEFVGRAKWDWDALQAAGGEVTFEDTHNLGSYKDYAPLKVPWGGYMFPAYHLNCAYEENDVFVSLAKLKNHATAGVTLSIKNCFGITPNSLYGNDAGSERATGARIKILHEGGGDPPSGVAAEHRKDTPRDPFWRVPRVTADMLGIRPIHLAIIEGVETITAGEGPWNRGVKPVQPCLLFAGLNAVCTDSVATTAMGHDPMAKAGVAPFPGDNHLQLAANAGLGTNDPSRIEVRGLSIKEARFPFTGPVR